MSVAVIVPTFRRRESVFALLEALRGAERRPEEIVVVDNDPTVDATLEAGCRGRGAHYLHLGGGLLLAGARNAGWRSTSADLCVFIDDDNVASSGLVADFIRAAEDHPDAAVIAPVITEYGSARIWCAGVRRSMITTRTTFLYQGRTDVPASPWNTEDCPDAFAVRRTALEAVGGFDDKRFPFHYDEADFCARLRARALRAIVAPSVRIAHRVTSVRSVGEELLRASSLGGGRRIELIMRARIYFHRRHSSGLTRVAALFVFLPVYVCAVVASCLIQKGSMRRKLATIGSVLAGVREGYAT